MEDVLVDGCTCPDGMYQTNEGKCVPKSQCDCYINDEVIQPGKLIHIDDNKWYGNYKYTCYDFEIKGLCFSEKQSFASMKSSLDLSYLKFCISY